MVDEMVSKIRQMAGSGTEIDERRSMEMNGTGGSGERGGRWSVPAPVVTRP
jgi:hypothetical protein